jgi:DNA replication and repair protein RecF
LYLSHLALTNYRNFNRLELDMPSGLVFVVGANAQGKSNLLEAAYLLALAKSHRTNTERELVSWSAQPEGDAPVEGTLITGEVEQREGRLKVVIALRVLPREGVGGALVHKQIRVNGAVTSAVGLVGRITAVLFTASDIELVLGAPSGRRRFLDILISQVDRGYLRTLQRYQRVLSQRNHLLRMVRDGRGMPDELDFWDVELVKEGSAVVARRREVMEHLAPLAVEAYARLSGGEDMTVAFQPSAAAEELSDALAGQRREEVKAGMTLVGPHRDDLVLHVGEMAASTYASRGQARTIALGLRLAEAAFLQRERREGPVLLLDDVLSELDTGRRRQVLEEAAKYEQAVVTAAEPALISDAPVAPSATFMLRDGNVELSRSS